MMHHLFNADLPRRRSRWAPGILFTLGLILVCSDGALFPWGNLAGLVLVALMAWVEE
uniref:Uncharacterized protein n=1 Tax=viral metagenome TaxID=1070528 RepID=A0A6M3LLI0_9ZZZZ